jgi:hypothetical protein
VKGWRKKKKKSGSEKVNLGMAAMNARTEATHLHTAKAYEGQTTYIQNDAIITMTDSRTRRGTR